MLSYEFMQRALIAAVIVGMISPLIGVFLVQRRLALLGDGMGHVAIAGVGLAFLTGTEPVITALFVSILGALILELVRHKSRSAGDLALALIFYGGIAGGVLLTSLAGGRASTALNQYLFGSLSTVSTQDFVALGVSALALIVILLRYGNQIFAMSLDGETARVQGIRVTAMSVLLTSMAAVTVVVGMRTVGLLLVSAIMIVPVAAAQQLTHSFKTTGLLASAIGMLSATGGLTLSFYVDVPPGPTIVLLALAIFVVLALTTNSLHLRHRNEIQEQAPHQH
ncbi:MAG: metal ABC transporter permease [Actinobacteria bacterium]|nr:metal ABC transporter permease [Actinomycetota bacterium]